ncbi:hypothetical protein [Sphingomonas sp. KC8]|uniref:hypothetical protein n=1 Tax=Sphingomonas sp. KC8 TaxID=1030157 RepID=UPI000248BEA1|nr:hypothetical protein [Sphingomonas sp. KC8]ARS25923.1 hypothetical protein KC8_01250 [Sphingomonas sp. KC8]
MRRLMAILVSGIAASCSPVVKDNTAQSPDWLIGQGQAMDAAHGAIRVYAMTRTAGGVTIRYAIAVPESDSRPSVRSFSGESGDCRRAADANLDTREPLARRAVQAEAGIQVLLDAMQANKCPFGPSTDGIVDGFRAAFMRVEQMAAIGASGQ